jgi:hypothetical protein
MKETEPFKNELDTYEREKERLICENEGRFVVIHGNDILGVWDTYEDALKSGYEKVKLERFLVKQIQGIDQIHFFTRDLALCQS